MKESRPSSWHPVLLALALLAALCFAGLGSVQPVAAASGAPQAGEDESCLGCHGQPGQSVTLPSGEQLPLSIDVAGHQASVHTQAGVTCTACHTDINLENHPDPDNPVSSKYQDLRDAAIGMYSLCQQCHAEKYAEGTNSVHQVALANGNRYSAVCSDCHSAHTQIDVKDENGTYIPEARVREGQTCARCHNAIYQLYSTSAHGELLQSTGNIDVPTCSECHGAHNIPDPTTASWRINSPNLCGSCHADREKMAKYGLSHQVMETYVADFHGTTVTLFQKQAPDQPSNEAVCYDCHGAHDIAHTDDPERGLQIRENLLATCQRCHPNATEDFPTSWASHYIPSRERNPLVYYVNLFYRFFIPGVLGAMAIFVLSDIYRRFIRRRNGGTHS